MDEKKMARAEVKYARISPRKVGIICDMIRGKDVAVARALMQHTPKAGPYVPHQQAHQPHHHLRG